MVQINCTRVFNVPFRVPNLQGPMTPNRETPNFSIFSLVIKYHVFRGVLARHQVCQT